MSDKQFIGEDHAKIYCSYRKDYPDELVEKIISFLKEKWDGPLRVAVDVGCGAGQCTVALAPHFEQVYGLDASEAQIRQAEASRCLPNLKYAASPAEKLDFEDGSVQLMTAATALHWFDLDRFFPEARRVLCTNGVLAVFGYVDMKLSLEDPVQAAKMDRLFEEYYDALDPYLLPNAQILRNRYKSIDFPFEEVIRPPDMRCSFEGRPLDIVNYVSTWSGLQNYRKADPQAAGECVNRFQKRLNEIAASSNLQPDDVTTLFRDFQLILCRKTKD